MSAGLELLDAATTPTMVGSVEGFHVRLAIKVGHHGPVIDVVLTPEQAAGISDMLRNLAITAAERLAANYSERAERLADAAEDANARRG
jgi:hypothetical protein